MAKEGEAALEQMVGLAPSPRRWGCSQRSIWIPEMNALLQSLTECTNQGCYIHTLV